MIRAIRVSVVCFAAVVSPAFMCGQTEVMFSPVPLWSGTGAIPDGLAEHNVFLKPETQEVLVLEDAADGTGKKIRFSFELRNQAYTEVGARASKNPNSAIHTYTYSLRATARSRRGIEQFSLLVPQEDAGFSARGIEWEPSDEITQKAERPAHKHIPLKYVHLKAKASNGILPGQSSSLQITSTNLPGYIQAVVRSRAGKVLTKFDIDSLPEKIAEKLALLSSPEFDGSVQLTVGPKFVPGTPRDIIAANIQVAIRHFLARNQLQHDSPFVTGALSTLENYIASESQSSLVGTQLNFLAAAKTAREIEIADVVRLSLAQ